jgi:hypothetical protein
VRLLETSPQPASLDEAAAILVAIEQFARDTSNANAQPPVLSEWLLVARREAISRGPAGRARWDEDGRGR